MGRVELSRFLSGLGSKLTDQIFIGVAEHISFGVDQVGILQDLDHLSDGIALLLVARPKPCGIQVHIGKQAVKKRVGFLDPVKGRLKLLPVEPVVCGRLQDAGVSHISVQGIVERLLYLSQELVLILRLHRFLKCLLRLFQVIRHLIIQKIVNPHKIFIRQVFVKNEPQQIRLILVGVHLAAEDICPAPEY